MAVVAFDNSRARVTTRSPVLAHRSLVAALTVIAMLAALLWLPRTAAATELYVAGSGPSGNAISPFSIAANGSLTPISCPGSNCSAGAAPIGVAMRPDGRYLYASSFTPSRVSVFAVAANGSLTGLSCPGSSCNTGTGPYGIAVSPNGQFLYTANQLANSVSPFAIGSDGMLTPIGCPGSSCNTGTQPWGVAVSPDGQFLYASSRGSNTVSVYSIAADGSLTPVACGSCGTGSQPSGIAITPDGQHLYTANRSGASIGAFAINVNGTLAALSCGTGCSTGTSGAFSLAISPDGRYLYATIRNAAAKVAAFSIGSNGLLTPVSCPGSNCTTASNPAGVAVSPDSRFAYAAVFGSGGGPGTALPYSIGSNGSLTPISCVAPNCSTAAGPDFQSVVVSPDQAPSAAFNVAAASPGELTSFDALASAASPGRSIVRYDWDFGDGNTASDAGPTPTHTYSSEGEYTVTLTVTDDAGCSTSQTFTGQTVSCNGSTAAQRTELVAIQNPPPPSGVGCPEVHVSVSSYAPTPAGIAATIAGERGPTVPGVRARFTVPEPSQLQIVTTLRWQQEGRGRRVELGARTVGDPGMRNLRLALPQSLADDLPRGTSVKVRFRVAALPDSAPVCVPEVQRLSLRTRIVKVLASAARLKLQHPALPPRR